MIPKVIHYCWFGGNPLPNSVKQCIKSWQKFCPDYEIKRWDESNFDVNSHPFMKKAYEEKAWAFVSDYARLKIVYDNGGIYLDTDVELVKSLDSLLCHNCYFGLQQAGHFIATGLGFGAEKQSMILKKIMDSYNAITFSLEKKEELACPKLNTQIFEKEGYIYSSSIFENEKFTIYPAKYFDPYMTHHGGVNLFCDDTYSIHHYSATWCDSSQILKRKLVRFVGADNIIKIRNFIHNLFPF